jgi:hypothetical protein
MNNMVKGAGAPAEPAPRPLTLFNTLITVPRNTADALGFQRSISGRKVVKRDVEPRFGVGQQSAQRRAGSLCWNGLRGHKRHKNMLDSNFSPAYTLFMKKDRLHKAASVIS